MNNQEFEPLKYHLELVISIVMMIHSLFLQPEKRTSLQRDEKAAAIFYARETAPGPMRLLISYNHQSDPYSNSGRSALDTASQRILLVGDSMVEGLAHPFRYYCSIFGHSVRVHPWYSSTMPGWSSSSTLDDLIAEYKPTFIIIALGSNELFTRKLKERGEAVRAILRKTEGKKMLWIGPPNWTEDNGINIVLYETLGKGRFFCSKNLRLDRSSDGRHPNRFGYSVWADSIVRWIEKESDFPINIASPLITPDLSAEAARGKKSLKNFTMDQKASASR